MIVMLQAAPIDTVCGILACTPTRCSRRSRTHRQRRRNHRDELTQGSRCDAVGHLAALRSLKEAGHGRRSRARAKRLTPRRAKRACAGWWTGMSHYGVSARRRVSPACEPAEGHRSMNDADLKTHGRQQLVSTKSSACSPRRSGRRSPGRTGSAAGLMAPTGYEPGQGQSDSRYRQGLRARGKVFIRCEVLDAIPNNASPYDWKRGDEGNVGGTDSGSTLGAPGP